MLTEVTLVFNRKSLKLPKRVRSHEEFEEPLLTVRKLLTGSREATDRQFFLSRMYYLLGWFLGDLGKHFGSERLLTVSVDLSLTRRHLENVELGNYVFECIGELGIRTKRAADRKPGKSSECGAFLWSSRSSPVFGWFHEACLGLKWNQRPSHHPVKLGWLLSASNECRLWFARGLADSDGDVHSKDKTVDITTAPNTFFVKALLESLDCHVTVSSYRRASRVTITASEAARIAIFNPVVDTHRRKTLMKLIGATTFERHWPAWLQAKVNGLLGSGLSTVQVRNQLLAEDNVFVKLHTLSYKARRLAADSGDSGQSAEGGTGAAERLRTPDPQISSQPRIMSFTLSG